MRIDIESERSYPPVMSVFGADVISNPSQIECEINESLQNEV